MKKEIITLCVILMTFAGSSFAATPKSVRPVPATIESAFTHHFAKALNIQWEEQKNFFKVTFEDRGRTEFAFFADNGDLMGLANNLSSTNLTDELRSSIKNDYFGYWITDLFSFCNDQEQGFVVTLENADKVVVLKAVDNRSWTVYKTTEKK